MIQKQLESRVDGAAGKPRRNHAAHGRHQPEHHAARRRSAGGLDLVPVLAQTGIAELVTAVGLAVGFTLGG